MCDSDLKTIGEVSKALGLPQQILRFWETKFPQLKPLRKDGAKRYYRKNDIILLDKISDLLYKQGNTIKQAKAILEDEETNLLTSSVIESTTQQLKDVVEECVVKEVDSEKKLDIHNSKTSKELALRDAKIDKLLGDLIECKRLLDNCLDDD